MFDFINYRCFYSWLFYSVNFVKLKRHQWTYWLVMVLWTSSSAAHAPSKSKTSHRLKKTEKYSPCNMCCYSEWLCQMASTQSRTTYWPSRCKLLRSSKHKTWDMLSSRSSSLRNLKIRRLVIRVLQSTRWKLLVGNIVMRSGSHSHTTRQNHSLLKNKRKYKLRQKNQILLSRNQSQQPTTQSKSLFLLQISKSKTKNKTALTPTLPSLRLNHVQKAETSRRAKLVILQPSLNCSQTWMAGPSEWDWFTRVKSRL